MPVRKRDNDYHTYADYFVWSRTWGDELIQGTAYVREPAPSFWHQMIVGEIHRQVANALQATSWRVCIAPLDVRLPRSNERDEDVDTVVQPDVFITRDHGKIDSRGLRGAPDWLVEVLSPSTAHYDEKKKVPAYERAGVSEVWLVNPRTLTVTIYRLSQGVYEKPEILRLEGRTALGIVPEVGIDWEPVLAKIRLAE